MVNATLLQVFVFFASGTETDLSAQATKSSARKWRMCSVSTQKSRHGSFTWEVKAHAQYFADPNLSSSKPCNTRFPSSSRHHLQRTVLYLGCGASRLSLKNTKRTLLNFATGHTPRGWKYTKAAWPTWSAIRSSLFGPAPVCALFVEQTKEHITITYCGLLLQKSIFQTTQNWPM